MALNFWFGKKEAKSDQAMVGGVLLGTVGPVVLSEASADASASEAPVPEASCPVAAGGPRAEPVVASVPVSDVPGLAPAALRSSSAEASAGSKVVLKAVGGGGGVVRLRTPGTPAVAPAASGPAAAAPGAFGLQPRGGQPTAPEQAGAAPVPVASPAPPDRAADTRQGTGVVRLRAPETPAGTPVASGPAAIKPGVFGLRPRGGQSAASEQAVAAPAPAASPAPPEKAADTRQGTDVVRPKSDQRALYYQLMNGLYDALLILDDQGHVVDCGRRTEELLGYTREEAWDLPVGKIVPGMTSQMFEHLKQNLAENHHILIDARCVRKDGSSFAGEVGVSTLSLTRGTNMVFAVRNVERRKKAMEELRKSRAALDSSLAPTFVCDPEGLFLIVNRALLEAFGIPDEEQAKSLRFMDLLPDASRFFLRAVCGEKVRETLKVMLPNGASLKLELTLQPVQSGQNVTAVAGSLLQA